MVSDLIKYLSKESNYSKTIKFIKEAHVPREAWALIEYLPKYFKDKNVTEVLNWSDFYTTFALENPQSKNLELIQTLCEKLESDKEPVTDEVTQMFTNRTYAEAVAEEAIKVAEGRTNSFINIFNTLDDYKRVSVKLEKALMEELGSEDMLDSLDAIKTSGMTWYLDCLNKLLGPLNNEFILLASRPDGGKTTLLANECWYLAKQLPEGKQILWFNNEEHIRKVKLRVIQSFLGWTKEDVLADKITAVKKYEDEFGKDKIIFIDDANHINRVEKAIDRYNPGLIIVDQLYKVQGAMGGKNEVEAERFRKLCEWAREIAKHTAPVIASNQLDGSAEGVKYPPMGALYGSKTGAQGEADAILLIGKTPVDGDKRFIYCPKNKLTGSNDQCEVMLDKYIARYRSI